MAHTRRSGSLRSGRSRLWWRVAGVGLATVLLVVLLIYAAAPRDGNPPPRPAATAAATEELWEPRSVTVLGAGDLLIHDAVSSQAQADGGGDFDFAPMLSELAPAISDADLALCHLEVPMGEPDGPFSGYPSFEAPPHLAEGIAETGYDGCSTASNHTLDQGQEGLERTLDVLEDAGLGAAGTASDEQEAETPQLYEVDAGHGDPVAVAHLSYTYGFNGLSLPEGRGWMANLVEVEQILAEAQSATEAGADVVVLSMHWGTEYSHTADAQQEQWATDLIDSPDIHVILGHHAHVVQPVERFGGEWVVYGMGNQLSAQHTLGSPQREGVMAQVTFTEVEDGQWYTEALEAIPTWLATDPLRVVNLAEELSDANLPEDLRQEYQGAYDRITGHLDGEGGLDDGLVVTAVD